MRIWILGAGIADQDRNILTNQHMLLDFFASAASMLAKGIPPKVALPSSGKKKKAGGNEDDSGDEDVTADGQRHEQNLPGKGIEDADQFQPSDNIVTRRHGDYERPAPKRQGTILVTLRDSSPYTLWYSRLVEPTAYLLTDTSNRNVPQLAKKPPMNPTNPHAVQPRYTQIRSFTFDPAAYPGYEHRRTIGFVKGGNEDILRSGVDGNGKCRTWEFLLRGEEEED